MSPFCSPQLEHSRWQEQSRGARAVSFGLLMCFNLCTCQGSSASYSNIHELGRYWITNSAPPLFSPKKGKRQRREGQSQTSEREEGGQKGPL